MKHYCSFGNDSCDIIISSFQVTDFKRAFFFFSFLTHFAVSLTLYRPTGDSTSCSVWKCLKSARKPLLQVCNWKRSRLLHPRLVRSHNHSHTRLRSRSWAHALKSLVAVLPWNQSAPTEYSGRPKTITSDPSLSAHHLFNLLPSGRRSTGVSEAEHLTAETAPTVRQLLCGSASFVVRYVLFTTAVEVMYCAFVLFSI